MQLNKRNRALLAAGDCLFSGLPRDFSRHALPSPELLPLTSLLAILAGPLPSPVPTLAELLGAIPGFY